jgi:hypothetical protein
MAMLEIEKRLGWDGERKRATTAGGGAPPKSQITGPKARSPAGGLHFQTEPPPGFELHGSPSHEGNIGRVARIPLLPQRSPLTGMRRGSGASCSRRCCSGLSLIPLGR